MDSISSVTLFLEFPPREYTDMYKQEFDHNIFIIKKHWTHHKNSVLRIGYVEISQILVKEYKL